MNRLYFLLLLCLTPSAFSAASCQTDSADIISKVKSMNIAFAKGDAELIMEMTDPMLFELTGGKEVVLSSVQQLIAQMKQDKMVIEKFTVKELSKTYKAEKKSVCFVPTEMEINVNGTRARSVGYLVAINRNTDHSSWLFLDSAGLRKDPELLWKLVPGLPKNVQLPPNLVEKM